MAWDTIKHVAAYLYMIFVILTAFALLMRS